MSFGKTQAMLSKHSVHHDVLESIEDNITAAITADIKEYIDDTIQCNLFTQLYSGTKQIHLSGLNGTELVERLEAVHQYCKRPKWFEKSKILLLYVESDIVWYRLTFGYDNE